MLVCDDEENIRNLADRVSEFLRNPVGQPEKLDLIEEIRKLLPVFHGGVRFIEPQFERAPVLFDREKLRSVLENLMKNAIESCEGSETDVEVELTEDSSGFFHLFIRDRGCGIPADDRDKVFNPFYTTKINGSGIGLSISSQFLKAAGGSLHLYQRDGGGTTAEATLPYHGDLKV